MSFGYLSQYKDYSRRFFSGVFFAFIVVAVVVSFKGYFIDFPKNMAAMEGFNHRAYLARQERIQSPGFDLYCSPRVAGGDALAMIFSGIQSFTLTEEEDLMRGSPEKGRIGILDPLSISSAGFFLNAFPNCVTNSVVSGYSQDLEGQSRDPYMPLRLFLSIKIPSGDLKLRNELKMQSGHRPESLIKYGDRISNDQIDGDFLISGTLIAPMAGGKFSFSRHCSSANLLLNGKAIPWGKGIVIPGGLNRLEFKGRYSPQDERLFPFVVELEKTFFGRSGEIVFLPSQWRHGIRLSVTDAKPEDNPEYWEAIHASPEYRFGLIFWRNSWDVRGGTVIVIPKDGPYQIGSGPHCALRIEMDGKKIFCNFSKEDSYSNVIQCRKNQRIKIHFQYLRNLDDSVFRAIQLMWKIPGAAIFVPVPAEQTEL